MSYLVLARKWRPRVFDDIVGQEFIVRALKNAVSTGKVAHAMLFSGPRGVGKTSAARILAKALNCSSPLEPGVPCSECRECKDIQAGGSLDVVELDAASHTGVNDVREIIENIKYLPTTPGNTKIYIIDEVHMLSQSAFNALLKTLEEPPPGVLFVLATTEVHKIPATILSRCQRYEFQRVPGELIKERVERITAEEGITIPEDTLHAIAREADGSMRDALSILDQLIATFGSDIDGQDAARLLRITDRALVRETLVSILGKDPRRCLEILAEVSTKGVSPRRFAEEVLGTVRNALLIKASGAELVTEVSGDEAAKLGEIVSGTSLETLEVLFKLMLESTEEVHRSFYPRMALEAALVRLTLVQDVVPMAEIIERLEGIGAGDVPGEGSGAGQASGQLGLEIEAPYDKKQEERAKTGEKDGGQGTEAALQVEHEPVAEAPGTEGDDPGAGSPPTPDIPGFIEHVKKTKPVIATYVEGAARVTLEGATLLLEYATEDIHSVNIKNQSKVLEGFVEGFFGRKAAVEVTVNPALATEAPSPGPGDDADVGGAPSTELLDHAMRVFGGKIIRVNDLKKE